MEIKTFFFKIKKTRDNYDNYHAFQIIQLDYISSLIRRSSLISRNDHIVSEIDMNYLIL